MTTPEQLAAALLTAGVYDDTDIAEPILDDIVVLEREDLIRVIYQYDKFARVLLAAVHDMTGVEPSDILRGLLMGEAQ